MAVQLGPSKPQSSTAPQKKCNRYQQCYLLDHVPLICQYQIKLHLFHLFAVVKHHQNKKLTHWGPGFSSCGELQSSRRRSPVVNNRDRQDFCKEKASHTMYFDHAKSKINF